MSQHDDMAVFIWRDGANLITDSRAVALAFGKRHRDVLRIIHAMESSHYPEIRAHRERNFEPTMYTIPGPKGATRMEPMYRMTAKGMSELAMSFTSDQARVIRIRFINAFEEVANRLANAEKTLTDRLREFERRAIPSATKGKLGSRLMHERRHEKRGLDLEEAMLKAQAQPTLTGLVQAPVLEVVGRTTPASNDSKKRTA